MPGGENGEDVRSTWDIGDIRSRERGLCMHGENNQHDI
jgi:hypothetical protein